MDKHLLFPHFLVFVNNNARLLVLTFLFIISRENWGLPPYHRIGRTTE